MFAPYRISVSFIHSIFLRSSVCLRLEIESAGKHCDVGALHALDRYDITVQRYVCPIPSCGCAHIADGFFVLRIKCKPTVESCFRKHHKRLALYLNSHYNNVY